MIMDISENDSGFTTCNLSSDMSLNGATRILSKAPNRLRLRSHVQIASSIR